MSDTMGLLRRRTAGNSLPDFLIVVLTLALAYAALSATEMGGSLPSWEAASDVTARVAEDSWEVTTDGLDRLWEASGDALGDASEFVRNSLGG